nr:MAG TPA: Protein of unknown function (DUF3934) [Caudoviricetes sp.]
MEQEQKRANPCYEWDSEGKKKWNKWNKNGTKRRMSHKSYRSEYDTLRERKEREQSLYLKFKRI